MIEIPRMRRTPTFLLFVALLMPSLAVSALEDGVLLFERPHYKGSSEVFFEDDANLKNNRIGNDKASSIQIPAGCTVTLFEHKNFKGRSIELTRDRPNLAKAGFGKKVSSLRITWHQIRRPNRDLPHNAVILFKNKNFRGPYQLLETDTAELAPEYCGAGAIGSLRVPRGCLLTLYSNTDYSGRGQVFQRDVADFSTARIGYAGVSSARVQWEEGGRNLALPGPPLEAVVLFEHESFEGASEVLFEDDSNLVDNPIGNDRVSSIQIPPGVTVTLYQHKDYQGRAIILKRSHSDLGATRLGNDHLSSIRIRPHGLPAVRPIQARSVVLYEHENFAGRELGVHEDIANLKGGKFRNDSLSSIRVPAGFRVTLYQHAGYRGRSVVLTRDAADLGRSPVGNDQVSSLRIERTGSRFPETRRSDPRAGVILYNLVNFGGKSYQVRQDIDNLKYSEFGNDSLSSLRIPDGWRVIVYEHADFKGQSEVLYSDVLSLGRHRIGENRVSSLRVEWIGKRR